MTEAEPCAWWPDLGSVVRALRQAGHAAAAEALEDAVRAGFSSAELLGGVGVALRRHRRLRAGLDADGRQAWDAVLADVHRAYPLARLGDWLLRLFGRG